MFALLIILPYKRTQDYYFTYKVYLSKIKLDSETHVFESISIVPDFRKDHKGNYKLYQVSETN